MALLLVIAGISLIVVSILGTQGALGTLLATDGPAFIPWAAAIIIIAMIGSAPDFEGVGHALLALVVIAFFVHSGSGFFSQFSSAITSAGATTANTATASEAPATGVPISLSTSTGTNALSGLTGAIGGANSLISGVNTLAGLF